MQAIQLLSGTVKFPAGKMFETQYGQRVNAVVTLENGEEAKLWGNPDDHELKQLRKGQAVQLVKDTKGYKLVGSSPAPSPQSPVPTGSAVPPILESEQGREQIKTYVKWQAKLLKQCYGEVLNQFCTPDKNGEMLLDPTDAESVRSLAVTLYIAAQRKYNL